MRPSPKSTLNSLHLMTRVFCFLLRALSLGPSIVAGKRDAVFRTISQFLAEHPAAKRPNRRLRLYVYPISKTPFVVLYDFDKDESRMQFVFHQGASLKGWIPNRLRGEQHSCCIPAPSRLYTTGSRPAGHAVAAIYRLQSTNGASPSQALPAAVKSWPSLTTRHVIGARDTPV